MRMYSLTEDKLPHIGIIDPRTGAKVVSILVTVTKNIDDVTSIIGQFYVRYLTAGIHWSAGANA